MRELSYVEYLLIENKAKAIGNMLFVAMATFVIITRKSVGDLVNVYDIIFGITLVVGSLLIETSLRLLKIKSLMYSRVVYDLLNTFIVIVLIVKGADLRYISYTMFIGYVGREIISMPLAEGSRRHEDANPHFDMITVRDNYRKLSSFSGIVGGAFGYLLSNLHMSNMDIGLLCFVLILLADLYLLVNLRKLNINA